MPNSVVYILEYRLNSVYLFQFKIYIRGQHAAATFLYIVHYASAQRKYIKKIS